MYSVKLGSKENASLRIIWIHGWGLSHENMIPLAEQFKNQTENYVVDLPGFGKSKEPEKVYSSEDYADVVANFIKSLSQKKTIVVGHSAGGRIAIPLAKKYPELLNGIALIGGAGIPKKHSIAFKLYSKTIKTVSPTLKRLLPFLKNLSLGSSDYKNSSGIMRKIFINAISENMTETAKKVKIPTLLIYGARDTATPIYIGEEYKKLIPNSTLHILENSDHWGYMYDYKKQVHHYITSFIREKL